VPSEALAGYTYPAGTDLAGTTDDAIRTLAEQVRLKSVLVFASAAARTAAFATAGVTPTEGMVSYLLDVHRLEVYGGATPGWLRADGRTFIRKTLDEPIANNTIQNDDHLFADVLANRIYRVEQHLSYFAVAAADFAFDWVVPAGCTGTYTATNPTLGSGASAPYLGALAWSSGGTFEGQGIDMYARFSGLLVVGGTPGTVRFRWAQVTTNAGNPSIVRANSWLELRDVT